MKIKVAINGFGRIGRLVFRILKDDPEFEVVAINDLGGVDDLAYLLKYDTVHGRYKVDEIEVEGDRLIVSGQSVKVFGERELTNLPWGSLGIDLVFECTGVFTSLEKAMPHIKVGARKVIISAPAGDEVKMIVYNVNHEILTGEEKIVSAASCTTNCLAPVLKVLEDHFGIESGFMTTVHAYTNDQNTLDSPHRKGIKARRGRAAAANIVPTSTGAASAIGAVIPTLKGRLDGKALRVPVQDGSAVDLVLSLKQHVTVNDINQVFHQAANETLVYTEDPIVSSDVIGTYCGAVFDSLNTEVLTVGDEQLVKVLAWYDNEMGYSAQMVRVGKYLAKRDF